MADWFVVSERDMRILSALACIVFVASSAAFGFTVDELTKEFDAKSLTIEEKRFLQFGLALSGKYSALTDGAWGAGSQRALEKWVIDSKLDLPVENWHAVFLADETQSRFKEDGWVQRYFEPLDLSFAIPAGQMREEPASDSFLNFVHSRSSLRYSLTLGNPAQVSRIHAFALSSASSGSEPYTLRRDKVLITSVEQPGGTLLYIRSDLRSRGWASVALSASKRDENLLTAVAGSITKSWSGPMQLPEDGELSEGFASVAEVLVEAQKSGDQHVVGLDTLRGSMTGEGVADQHLSPVPTAPAALPSPPTSPVPADLTPVRQSTGTAFYVAQDGHMLTNAHVVKGCQLLKVDGRTVILVAADEAFDLALIKDVPPPAGQVAKFSDKPVPLNADITVAGFPLAGLLSGLNVTRGSVTSQKGIGGDAIQMQISAPVQPGNSGGPAVDASGRVVGVVVAKLDAKSVSDTIGDIPQNVNFAVRAEIAKLFMFQNGVEPILADDVTSNADPVALASDLEKVTKLVECYAPRAN